VPSARELIRNIDWVRSIQGEDHSTPDGALRWSRAKTLLLQRGPAYAALVPFESQLLVDHDASIFYAPAPWAAGADDAARNALTPHVHPADAARLLASWSIELGRE